MVPQWIFLEVVSGLGVGLLFPSLALVIQSSVPRDKVGIAATLVLFFRFMGQALGVAIGGAVLDNQLRTRIPVPVTHGLGPGEGSFSAVALVELLKRLPPRIRSPSACAARWKSPSRSSGLSCAPFPGPIS